ncbi:MAG: response regulator [Lachnospiraceae bacterium]|jgi:two-component system response regulator YesN
MRTFSVVFIDDEAIIRNSFRSLIDWENTSFRIAGIFDDGNTAWDYIRTHNTDIVISDINMPFLSGLDLLRQVNTLQNPPHVILLTGYEYFEYAKKAIEYRAFDFLVKPITSESLMQAIMKASLDISEKERQKEAVKRDLDAQRRGFLSDIFSGKGDAEALSEQAKSLSIPVEDCFYAVMGLSIDSLIESDAAMSSVSPHTTRSEIYEKIRLVQMTEKTRPHVDFKIYPARNTSKNLHFLLVFSQKDVPDREAFFRGYLRQFCSDVIRSCNSAKSFSVTISCSPLLDSLETAQEACSLVDGTLSARHILGIGKYLPASRYYASKPKIDKITLPTDTILHHIRQGMSEAVKEDLSAIYNRMRHEANLSLENSLLVTTELALTIFQAQKSAGDGTTSYLYYLDHIQHLHTLDEMEADITAFAVKTADSRHNSSDSKKILAQNALDYIAQHYCEEALSISDVASHLGISVPYLGVLLRQETGKNFSTHLTAVRMEKAKELLRSTDRPVSEIAESTGYSNPQYFSVCFKKYTGTSPGEFRKQRC